MEPAALGDAESVLELASPVRPARSGHDPVASPPSTRAASGGRRAAAPPRTGWPGSATCPLESPSAASAWAGPCARCRPTEAAWIDGEITRHHVAKLATAQARAPERLRARREDARRRRPGAALLRLLPAAWSTGSPRPTPTASRTGRASARPAPLQPVPAASRTPGSPMASSTPSPAPSSPPSSSASSSELFVADWAEAKARLGRDPLVARAGPHPGPAPGRRRCVEMAIRSKMAHAERPPARAAVHRAGRL